MFTFLVVIHVIVAVFLILVVLLQTGKGAAMGSAFGSGASQTVFGSAGAGNILTKLTTGAAVVFMLTSLTLSTVASKRDAQSVIGGIETKTPEPSAPPKADAAKPDAADAKDKK